MHRHCTTETAEAGSVYFAAENAFNNGQGLHLTGSAVLGTITFRAKRAGEFFCKFDNPTLNQDYPSSSATILVRLKNDAGFPMDYSVNNVTVPIIAVPGDVDNSGIVDITDLTQVAEAYGCRRGQVGYRQVCDLNGDGIIDICDLTLVAVKMQ